MRGESVIDRHLDVLIARKIFKMVVLWQYDEKDVLEPYIFDRGNCGGETLKLTESPIFFNGWHVAYVPRFSDTLECFSVLNFVMGRMGDTPREMKELLKKYALFGGAVTGHEIVDKNDVVLRVTIPTSGDTLARAICIAALSIEGYPDYRAITGSWGEKDKGEQGEARDDDDEWGDD